MTPGDILVERASRQFRVYPRPVRTLKELALKRGRMGGEEVWALRDVSVQVAPGEAVGIVGRNGSGKSTLLRLIAGIIRPTSGRVEVGGRVASLLELGAGFHPDFTGRENVYLNGSILGLKRSYIREQLDEIVAFAELERSIDLPVRTYSSGMYMRLGFAIAAHLDADVLLLDEVFAVGDEGFQRKCFGKVREFKQRGGTIVFVSHDASAVERLCERAVLLREGLVDYDGSTRGGMTRYHQQLAEARDPAEREAGLREWGSGEVRIVDAALLGIDGEPRLQLLSGEPFRVRLRVAASRSLAPPRLRWDLRDEAGLLLTTGFVDLGELGWDGGSGERILLFDAERIPLGDGRFRLQFGLTDATGERTYHRLEEGLRFLVYPGSEMRGPVLIEGSWRMVSVEAELGAT